MPKREWKRCMEFKMKTEADKMETYYIDRRTGTAHKVLSGVCRNSSGIDTAIVLNLKYVSRFDHCRPMQRSCLRNKKGISELARFFKPR